MNQDKQKRIFWLGMHVVLVKTELPRLRELGYEVFNPPYLTNVYDQSAVVDWDRNQASTLPSEVFQKLSRYNFFYNKITPEIAELLDEYFGTVVVTISPVWLQTVLDSYHGRVIYRVYGQPGTLSEALWNMRLFRSIQERENFYFVPHAAEAIRDEHAWLKTRMSVVPYTLPLDVFDHENTWSPEDRHTPEIMVCCPNIDNPHFAHHYQYLNAQYPETHFKLYGVQPRRMPDPRVAGTLPRAEQLDCYRRAAGYFYHYQIPTSSYLPPIEMMTIGGPVVYMHDSLLARSFAGNAPGEASSVGDSKRKLQWLLDGDREFINEVRDAQQQIVRRYHPDHVHPIFDRVFTQLIDRPDVPQQHAVALTINSEPVEAARTYVLFHAPGAHIEFQEGCYHPLNDLARSVKRVVNELLAQTENEVVVTCFADQFQNAYGYLDATQFLGRLKFMVLDPTQLGTGSAGTKWESKRPVLATQAYATHETTFVAPSPIVSNPVATHTEIAPHASQDGAQHSVPVVVTKSRRRLRFRETVSRALWTNLVAALAIVGKSRVLSSLLLASAGVSLILLRSAQRVRARLAARKASIRARLGRYWRAIQLQEPWTTRRGCITRLNADERVRLVIVPHRSLFPEALFLEQPIVLYTDDDLGAPSIGMRQKINAFISRCIAEKSITVMTSADLTPPHRARSRRSAVPQSLITDNNSGSVPAPMGRRTLSGVDARREGALTHFQGSNPDERAAVNRTPPRAA